MSHVKISALLSGLLFFGACTTNQCVDGICFTPQVAVQSQAQEGAACSKGSATSGPFSGGDGSQTSPFVICSAAQLNLIASNPNYLDKNFVLAVDLDMSPYDASTADKTFQTIGSYDLTTSNGAPFTGTFDGASHTISNLKIDKSTTTAAGGLFAFTKGATIKNLKLTQINISGWANIGGLIGYSSASSVANVTVQGTMNAAVDLSLYWVNRLGGLIGFADGNGPGGTNRIVNSSTDVIIYGDDQVAGLIGSVVQNSGALLVDSCMTSGQLLGPQNPQAGNTFGGLISYINVNNTSIGITNSSSSAAVKYQGSFGGGFIGTIILGSNSLAAIAHSHSTGDFSTGANPLFWAHGSYNGGFVGIAGINSGSQLNIDKSFSTSNVTNTGANGGTQLGAFIGSLGAVSGVFQVSDSYATGTVSMVTTGSLYAGAFVGAVNLDSASSANFNRTYASGNVTVPVGGVQIGGYIGGILNNTVPTFTSNYWNTDAVVNGLGSGGILAGVSGEPLLSLENPNTFVGWDFNNVWLIDPTSPNTPVLR